MKKFALAGIAAAALVAVPAIAQLSAAPERGSMTRAQLSASVASGFAQIDADADGALTQDEAAEAKVATRAHRTERRAERRERRQERRERRAERRENRTENAGDRFARMDADSDGMISRAEFDAHVAARVERRTERRAERVAQRGEQRMGEHRGMRRLALRGKRFERADADGNGTVTLDEATTHVLTRFDAADANRDGTLTREERRANRQARRAARG